MRCLPASKVPLAQGRCLHDWHAEIVALRAFNYYLLQECHSLASTALSTSSYLSRRQADPAVANQSQQFAIRDDVKIYMYCSEAPCGDASMELIMAAQDDATPWEKPAATTAGALTGRGFFSELGVVRRKPARGDAPETLSKSCTDKLAMRQCTSVLSSLTSLFIHPGNAYIDKLVLPASQHVPAATARAFGPQGRMADLVGHDEVRRWEGGYVHKPFEIIETSIEFEYSRRSFPPGAKTTGSNITAMWTPWRQEVLIGGSIQGNKQFSVRGSSVTSKIGMWKSAVKLSQTLGLEELESSLTSDTYGAVKASARLQERKKVKEDVRRIALQNWIRNYAGDGFALSGSDTYT